MEKLKTCLPELRYLFHHLKPAQRLNYVKYGSTSLTECLANLGLNLMYSNKNGLKLSSSQIKALRKNKSALLKLIMAKSIQAQRKALSNKMINLLLTILMNIADQIETD